MRFLMSAERMRGSLRPNEPTRSQREFLTRRTALASEGAAYVSNALLGGGGKRIAERGRDRLSVYASARLRSATIARVLG